MPRTAADLSRQFRDAHAAILHEVAKWSATDAAKACVIHGEEADAGHLALHVATRGSKVAALLEERRFGQLKTDAYHSTLASGEASSAVVLEALNSAGAATLELINGLSDEEIERLHASEVDGEPDAIDGSCGLLGHWQFHLPALRETQQKEMTPTN
jgi:hypothetical protein